ncbi:Bacteriophage holin HP1 family protein [Bacteriophage APSE-3]|nr:Bacteriophage holin HP1 family protein [Bacteriophage APSE-3]
MTVSGTTSASYCWSFSTCMLGLFSLSDWALITGIICTLLTCVLNWYYRHKEYRFRVRKDNES